MIYFDNAATSLLKPPSVAEAVSSAMSSFGGVGRGAHPAALTASMAVYDARLAVSQLLGAPSAECVSFALNASMALNIAIEALLPSGGKAVTTAASHNSILRPLFRARDERGCAVEVVSLDENGALDYRELAHAVQGADVLAVTHAANVTGDVYDVARMAALAHEAGARVILDAAQTAGAFPVNMVDLGVDVLCFTGHKGLLGPQGTGGLCVTPGLELRPLLEGGSGVHSFEERHPRCMPEALEAGTLNAHGLAGLTAGISYIQERGVEAIAEHEARLRMRLEAAVRDIPGVRLMGGGGDAGHCGIVALTLGSEDSGQVASLLASQWGICVRAGAHCAPLMHRALGTEEQGVVRFSFGPFNTFEEVDEAACALKAIAEELAEQE